MKKLLTAFLLVLSLGLLACQQSDPLEVARDSDAGTRSLEEARDSAVNTTQPFFPTRPLARDSNAGTLNLPQWDWGFSEYGLKRIQGIVANNTDQTLDVWIEFSLYDSENYVVGTAFDIESVGPGKKWKFSAVVADETAVSAELSE